MFKPDIPLEHLDPSDGQIARVAAPRPYTGEGHELHDMPAADDGTHDVVVHEGIIFATPTSQALRSLKGRRDFALEVGIFTRREAETPDVEFAL